MIHGRPYGRARAIVGCGALKKIPNGLDQHASRQRTFCLLHPSGYFGAPGPCCLSGGLFHGRLDASSRPTQERLDSDCVVCGTRSKALNAAAVSGTPPASALYAHHHRRVVRVPCVSFTGLQYVESNLQVGGRTHKRRQHPAKPAAAIMCTSTVLLPATLHHEQI